MRSWCWRWAGVKKKWEVELGIRRAGDGGVWRGRLMIDNVGIDVRGGRLPRPNLEHLPNGLGIGLFITGVNIQSLSPALFPPAHFFLHGKS
jgi:hypothetical protein